MLSVMKIRKLGSLGNFVINEHYRLLALEPPGHLFAVIPGDFLDSAYPEHGNRSQRLPWRKTL